MAETVRLKFYEEARPDAAEVGHFMFLYGGVYAAAVGQLRPPDRKQWVDRIDKLEQRLRAHLKALEVTKIDELFSRKLGERAVEVQRLAVESPLEVVLVGIAAALAMAVILSGGSVKYDAVTGSFEAAMPALGEGIKKLREALTPRARAQLGYGVRPLRIKLSRQEIKELMKFDPKSEKKGGFQRLLIGMQYRINKTTRELELSEHDISMILKHGRHPEKGGWQASIKRIFGRHFDLESDA